MVEREALILGVREIVVLVLAVVVVIWLAYQLHRADQRASGATSSTPDEPPPSSRGSASPS